MPLTTPTGDELTIGTRVRYNARTGRPFAVRSLHGLVGTVTRLAPAHPHAPIHVLIDGDAPHDEFACHPDELTAHAAEIASAKR